MDKFTILSGTAAPLMRANIDTDQIIPKQFLKRIERTGYGQFLFHDWRFSHDGNEVEGFVLNDPRYDSASILITGENFGCGSSREHAPWSLLDRGFRAVVAPSFAGIFYNNCLKNGLLPVVLDTADVELLGVRSTSDPEYTLKIDLAACTISDSGSFSRTFEMDDFRRHCMLNGLDDIGLTLQFEEKITAYEERLFASA